MIPAQIDRGRVRRAVFAAVSLHLDRDLRLLDDAQLLGSHLGFDQLDLLLVAARVEDAIGVGAAFPLWRVGLDSTVAELVQVAEAWCADDDVPDTERSLAMGEGFGGVAPNVGERSPESAVSRRSR